MEIGKKIKKIRESKGLSAKEVISIAGIGSAMYSRIENGVNEPSLATLEKIAKALGVKIADIFDQDNALAELNSYDSSLMEKVKIIETLPEEERKTVFSVVDAFITKQKLKKTLSNALMEV